MFEGNERLIGRTVSVRIDEATAFTLFGTVETGEQVGVERDDRGFDVCEPTAQPTDAGRFSLPIV